MSKTTTQASEIAAAVEAERQRIRTIEALGREFEMCGVAGVLSCETNETPEECRRILGLLVKAGADQKARANNGWDRAYAVANRIAGRNGPASQYLDPLPGTPAKSWEKAIAKVNGETTGRGASAFEPCAADGRGAA